MHFRVTKSFKRNRFVYICGVIILILIVKKILEHFLKSSISYQTFVNFNYGDKKSEEKYILLWTSFFGRRNWYIAEKDVETIGPDYLEENCPAGSGITNFNCVITTNSKLLKSVSEFDAVIFHGSERRPFFNPAPSERSTHQKYVMAKLEPQSMTHHDYGLDDNFYNWTMTYRMDSDILWPYNYLLDIERNEIVAPALAPKWREPEDVFDNKLIKLAKNKKFWVAWFVSHCKAVSRRDDLANALANYMPVSIFGTCGALKCGYDEDCLGMIEGAYKFYLSFENELIPDYVTEKLYDYMKINTIPVVFGGADYKRFAPPRSYIDANDYETVEELANYMHYLADHPEEYIKYFWWKKYYKFVGKPVNVFCYMCAQLHNREKVSRTEVYPNMKGWIESGFREFLIRF